MSGYLFAQKKNVIFDHYGVSEKLMAGQALTIEKSRSGYLWIGTEQGLYKYDGHKFKVFKTTPYDTTTLSSNYIPFIKEDKHGRIWAYANPELNVFDPVTEKCQRIQIPTSISPNNSIIVRSFFYDESKDVMWVGTNVGLLFSQGKEVNLKKFIIPDMKSNELVHFMHIDDSGIFWMGTDFGLYRYDDDLCQTTKFMRQQEGKEDTALGFFSGYFDEKEQVIWLGCWVHGLVKFDIRSKTMKTYKYREKNGQNGVLAISPSTLSNDANILWLGTVDGLYSFDKKKEIFYDYRSDNYKDIKGVSGAVFCLEPTDSEGMWIGSYKGLHRYDAFKQNIERVDIHIPNIAADWSPSTMIIEPNARKDSIMWFSVDYLSIYKYDLIHKKLLPIPEILKAYTDEVKAHSIFIDSQNILWIASYKNPLVGYDLESKSLVKPKDVEKGLIITTIVEDSNKNLWFGTSQGLYNYDRKLNVCQKIQPFASYIEKHQFKPYSLSITIDHHGRIWGIIKAKKGNEDCIYVFDPKTNEIRAFFQKDHLPLKKLKVLNNIKSISNDKIMLTSFNGACIIKLENKDIEFEEINPTLHTTVSCFVNIEPDNNGYVWLSSDLGVSRFDHQNQSMFQWNYYNSNMDIQVQPSLCYSASSNTLYMSQMEGFNKAGLDNIRLPKSSQIILSDLVIENKNDKITPPSGSELSLPISQNTMTFSFSNLSFTNSEDNKYEYSLGDENSPWKEMMDNTLTLNNLGFGEYLLRVKAENAFGLKSPNMYALYLTIEPPFWRTWWFNVLILGLISTLIYSIFKYRENQRLKLENLRFNIARDLHDDMGSNLSQIKMLSEVQAMKSQDPTFATISNKLSDVMQNMIEIVWSINPKYDDINHVVQRIQEFAIQTLEPQGIHLKFDIDQIQMSGLDPIHRRHLFLICKEAINNIHKYAKAKNVQLSVKSEAKNVTFTISDDGVGFDPKVIHLGNGLKNMQQRADELEGILHFETSGVGTKVKLMLPMKGKF